MFLHSYTPSVTSWIFPHRCQDYLFPSSQSVQFQYFYSVPGIKTSPSFLLLKAYNPETLLSQSRAYLQVMVSLALFFFLYFFSPSCSSVNDRNFACLLNNGWRYKSFSGVQDSFVNKDIVCLRKTTTIFIFCPTLEINFSCSQKTSPI